MTTTISTPTLTSANSQSPRSPSKYRSLFTFDNRYLAPVLITGILLVGQLSFGILESYTRTVLAIASSMVMELILARLITGKWPHLASAYITGISVGILIRSPAIWPYILCGLISITSKYAIRWHGRHLWNPSNLGVSAMLFLAPATVAGLSVQWGNALWPMLVIWLLGSLIIWRLRRFHICATYVISFLVLSGVRSAVTGDPWLAAVAPITGPMYQLFVFFMITDPKTTVRTKWGQCLVAFAVALAEAILRLNRVVHAPYYALFLVGPAANALEIWWDSRRHGASPVTAASKSVQPL
jgi:Na+-translocating ferredoxin:NAD+ oxidoreductase RnfD subunit